METQSLIDKQAITIAVTLGITLLMNYQRAVGYCVDPKYIPIKGQVAVMFEMEDFGRYWSHIPDYIFSEFLKSI